MKSKEDLKTIDPAVLAKVLGGVQPASDRDKKAVVIAQPPFASHFHS
jgi:hypothetical protein